jgi:phytoene synthase
MPDSALEASYRHCRRITRAAARNFYYAIHLLPGPKRDALCALYAFMRRADDISDSPGDLEARMAQMRAWRAALDRAIAGDTSGDPALAAFRHTLARFSIPPRYLHDLVSGTEMDLSISEYATFAALREYCYRVAGTVGLCCIHVFGFSAPRAPQLAEELGIAFQLTNILRDVVADAAMGRVYLPREDLERFGVARSDLGSTSPPRRELLALVRFEVERAWKFYESGWRLLPLVEPDARPALGALVKIYSGILSKIEERNYNVFSAGAVKLSAAAKTGVMLRAWLGDWNPDDELRRIEKRAGGGRGPGGTFLGAGAG